MIMPPQDQKKTKSRTILVSGSCTWFGTIIDQMKLMWRLPQPFMLLSDIYTLFDGLAYNTCGYFASCVVFFRAPQGRGKIRAMSKMSARIIC